MSTKFDFNCIYYANTIINNLHQENYFAQNLIDPENLRYVLLQIIQNNFDATGNMDISRDQMLGALSHSQKVSITENMEKLAADGLLTCDGIDDNGEFTYSITDLGRSMYDATKNDMIQIRKEIEEETQDDEPDE